jgi:hypothetical protein
MNFTISTPEILVAVDWDWENLELTDLVDPFFLARVLTWVLFLIFVVLPLIFEVLDCPIRVSRALRGEIPYGPFDE